MILRVLEATNFYSFKKCSIDFTKYNGIVYVKGVNRDSGGSNGSGKSSISEMVCFALFGKTIRKSTEEAIVNCDTKKSLVVKLEVEKPGVGVATITRGKKPTMLNFSVDGQELTQENAGKTQEKIESLLGINYKTYVASIVFGQHSDVEFLSATPDDKRTIIRNFLNLEKMFSYRDKIKDLKSEYSNANKVATTLLHEYDKQLSDLESKLQDVEPVEIKDSLEAVTARETKIENLKQLIASYKPGLETLQYERYANEGKHKQGVFCIKDTCKTCKKVYLRKQTKANINGLSRRIASSLKKEKAIQTKINSLKSKLTDLESKLRLRDWAKLKEKADLFSAQKNLKASYDELLARRASKEEERNNAEIDYEVMRFWEKAFSESGIIKYFIRNILDYLNFKTNEYLSILTNSQFTILFNEELDETITNNGRKLSYISLSGGEKRKINLAVMLSLQSLLTHTSKEQSDIIFFDEIAENMDEDGCKGVFNLLKALKDEDKTIFLITHNAYLKSLLDGCQILSIQKKDGESKII